MANFGACASPTLTYIFYLVKCSELPKSKILNSSKSYIGTSMYVDGEIGYLERTIYWLLMEKTKANWLKPIIHK